MPRKPLVLSDFTKGVIQKANYIGGPTIMRSIGWRMGRKVGTLESFGGFDDWDTSINFAELNGICRWYDEDGGATLYVYGNDGSQYGIWEYAIESKTCSFIQADTIIDRQAPVQFVNCGNQVIIIPQGKLDTPLSAKLLNRTPRISINSLGLPRPTEPIPTLLTIHALNSETYLEGGKYSWYISYSYGTKSVPEKYGESDLSDPVTIDFSSGYGFNSYDVRLGPLTPISGLITRINIYRTLRNGVTPYKIGYIDTNGVAYFYDTFKDSTINTSRTRPIYFGMPGIIRCGMWDNSRFYFFGPGGKFQWSAAGYPDVHPANFYTYIGDTGYEGTWIAKIRDTYFVGKEDGIFIILGQSPNYVWKKISDVQCFSRDSLVNINDTLYFLGKEGQDAKVYKFNGYQVTPISLAITSIFRDSTLAMHKRAVGAKVGKEYWLSIMTSDTRFAKAYVPFNNLILVYDTETGGWFPNLGDTAAITVCDGHMDNGEVFIVESDPSSSTSKGTIFRYNRMQSRANVSYMSLGVRAYSKIFGIDRTLSIIFPGIRKDIGSLQKIYSHAFKVRWRGILGTATPRLSTYDDSETLQKTYQNQILPEASETYNNLNTIGDSACLYGTGKYDTALYEDRLLEERLFNWNDQIHKYGMIIDLKTLFSSNKRLELEAIEYLYETDNEE